MNTCMLSPLSQLVGISTKRNQRKATSSSQKQTSMIVTTLWQPRKLKRTYSAGTERQRCASTPTKTLKRVAKWIWWYKIKARLLRMISSSPNNWQKNAQSSETMNDMLRVRTMSPSCKTSKNNPMPKMIFPLTVVRTWQMLSTWLIIRLMTICQFKSQYKTAWTTCRKISQWQPLSIICPQTRSTKCKIALPWGSFQASTRMSWVSICPSCLSLKILRACSKWTKLPKSLALMAGVQILNSRPHWR